MNFIRRLSQGGSGDEDSGSSFFSNVVAKKNGLLNNISSKIEAGARMLKTSSSSYDSSSAGNSPSNVPSPSSEMSRDLLFPDQDTDTKSESSFRANIHVDYGKRRRGSSSGYSDSSGGNDHEHQQTSNLGLDEQLNSSGARESSGFDQSKLTRDNRSVNEDTLPSNPNNHQVIADVHNQQFATRKYANKEEYEREIRLEGNDVDTKEPIREAYYTLGHGASSDNSQNERQMTLPQTAAVTTGHDPNTEHVSSRQPQSSASERKVISVGEIKSGGSSPTDSGKTSPFEGRQKAPRLTSKRRSSTVDEMLFDDYVSPDAEEEEEENANKFQRKTKKVPIGDLMSFDDESKDSDVDVIDQDNIGNMASGVQGMTLLSKDDKNKLNSKRDTSLNNEYVNNNNKIQPATNCKPVKTEKTSKSSGNVGPNDTVYHGFYGSGSQEQSFGQISVDSSENDFGGVLVRPRTTSMGSENSWSSSYSVESQPDDITLECMEFMKQFVDKIFSSENISQTEKAKFGELCQYAPGRRWFSRYVNSQVSTSIKIFKEDDQQRTVCQRVHSKNVPEEIFFQLVQYFAVVLFECNEAEDFSPAKSLMNMCFTFYYEIPNGNEAKRNFLYSFLREQPIWQSLRFWNAAFFDAVQCERARQPMWTNSESNEALKDDRHFQENITFGQLGTFSCNMRAFGLSKDLCYEFLRKQSTIANLSKEQVRMLKENVDKWGDS